jgi:hypothetical protein
VTVAVASVPSPAVAARRPRRGTELGLLIAAMLVVLVYAAAVEAGLLERITPDFWLPVAVVFAIFFSVHIAVRFLAPHADPVLLPTVALINGLGVAFLRRLDLAAAPPELREGLSIFSGGRPRPPWGRCCCWP